jgi:hypothetical protein
VKVEVDMPYHIIIFCFFAVIALGAFWLLVVRN